MSDEPQDEQAEDTGRPANVDENGELRSDGDDQEQDEQLEPDDADDEEAAEARAAIEREHELAAERQAEAASLEKQAREQDAMVKKLNQVAAHTVKRYKDILGDDLGGWVGCPMCADGLPGIRLPVMPEGESLARIQAAIGQDPDPPLHDDPYSRQCDSCGGYGVTKTNSHVTGQKSATCLDCGGKGWIAVGNERETNVVPITNGTQVPEVPPLVAPMPQPLQTETPRTREEETLRAQGAIVVWPPKPQAPPV